MQTAPATISPPTPDTQQYFVIPLSLQKEANAYVVGNADIGDFYQFPVLGVQILDMIRSGDNAAEIKSRLSADSVETVDVDGFLHQLIDIGFIYPQAQHQTAQEKLRLSAHASRRTFNVDPRLARAVFSLPTLALYSTVVLYAVLDAIQNPALWPSANAFYFETNRTPLLVIVLILSVLLTTMHELGHMLAAARQGVKPRYGIGNRLWNIVAESDLTGVLALPKSRRYLPMFAGLLVDVLSLALLTIALDVLLRRDAGAFTIQVVQVLVLETMIGMAWQFNVFVKTDIYFVLCNFFSHPDLDRDARAYLHYILHRVTLGRFGSAAPAKVFGNVPVLQAFTLIWVFGRVLSLAILVFVFLPTMWQYLQSAIQLLRGSPTSVWMACDTIVYVTIVLTMLGAGMYMWIKNQ
jgi:hypothetical protein